MISLRKITIRSLFILAGFFILTSSLSAQNKKYAISGYITDASNGESLIGATFYVPEQKTGVTANAYGFYSISLPQGKYKASISFVGFTTKEVEINLTSDQKVNILLEPSSNEIEEVVISSQRKNVNVSAPEMSVERLSMTTIKRIPALMGEVDVIKAIQLLPGVQATSEGSSGFSVRGGGYDQNLILLDEATVYSASHLMGFFSVFNNDAIKDVKLYKGDIPATFGGRLSSLMDIRTKDGNNQKHSVTGGIGTISSRLTLEGPIVSDRATYLVSARRTYADLFLKLASDPDLKKSTLYFYDMNAKVNYRINHNNRIYLAGYLGRDKFANKFAGMDFGNKTLTLRWNHIFSSRLFSNFTLIGSTYDYYLKSSISDQLSEELKSQLKDYGFKADLSYQLNPKNQLKFGYNFTHHTINPGEGGGVGDNSIISRVTLPKEYAMEHAVYLSNETKLGEKLTLKYGLRYSLLQNVSNGEEMNYLEDYQPKEMRIYTKGEVYNNQWQLEPRAGAMYQFNRENSVKASYSRTAQYIQLASNSTAGSPLDIWFLASQNVKPQLCDQFALGYFRNFANDMYEASIEFYYKDMRNVVDFKDHAELMINKNLEQELRFGKGESYGMEVMLRKNEGRLNGWISYTYSASTRQIDDINDGNWYRSPYDKPNNISVVLNYELSRKWVISANWVYASGMPATFPTGRYQVENNYVPIYSGRNEYRYPDYHRLDLSATWDLSKPGKKFHHELNFSLYNAYGRKNPWTILFMQEDDQPDTSYSEMVYLFSFVPSVTWNFNF